MSPRRVLGPPSSRCVDVLGRIGEKCERIARCSCPQPGLLGICVGRGRKDRHHEVGVGRQIAPLIENDTLSVEMGMKCYHRHFQPVPRVPIQGKFLKPPSPSVSAFATLRRSGNDFGNTASIVRRAGVPKANRTLTKRRDTHCGRRWAMR
jgi:hypothetical protein